jgi:hypothetical protein
MYGELELEVYGAMKIGGWMLTQEVSFILLPLCFFQYLP